MSFISSKAAGIPDSKLIEAHGSFATATCRKCRVKYNGSDLQVGSRSFYELFLF